MKVRFGDKVRRLRKDHKLSLKALSRESKISYHTLVSLERRSGMTIVPYVTTVIALAKYFKVSVDDLVENVNFEE